MTALLDANVLIALIVTEHVHHDVAAEWLSASDDGFATLGGVIGHRQVTDAYLAQLARTHKGQLATLDSGLAHLHSDVAMLVPV